MFKMLTRGSVRLVERYLPDPYIFVLLLTILAFICAMIFEGQSPYAVVRMWGGGFWGLLTFAMQMVLVLLTGFMLASTPLVRRWLDNLASRARTPGRAIVMVSLVALAASWINWGFGLVVGALFAKALARQVKVDYKLLVASAYSGFLVWHGGLAGSIPLTIATEGHFMQDEMGLISTSDTIFAFFNLAIVVLLFIAVPLVNYWMMPSEKESVYVDPELLKEPEDDPTLSTHRPADKLENNRVISWLVGFAGLAYMFDYFLIQRAGLNLNVINFSFLMLAVVLHGTPRRLLICLAEGIKGCGGIVLQFPFYAGIMAVMIQSGLAASIAEWLTSFATAKTLPFFTFLSGGLINMFVPSGGGQWAVQSPVAVASVAALDADMARTAMAVAWGDAWTNMLQPFWALPILAIAGLKAKDIMGFCVIQLIVSGIIISIGLTWF